MYHRAFLVARGHLNRPGIGYGKLTHGLPTVSGGFAVVQPNSSLSINAIEAYPLEDFSSESVRAQISEAQKVANGSGSEQDIAEAKIELEASSLRQLVTDKILTDRTTQVLESLQAALK